MIKYITFVLVLLAVPAVAVWTVTFTVLDETVTIEWDNFWSWDESDYLCFDDASLCYAWDSESIVKRSSNTIVFEPTFWVPIKWELLLYTSEGDQTIRYEIVPVVVGLFDENIEYQKYNYCVGENIAIVWGSLWSRRIWWSWGSQVKLIWPTSKTLDIADQRDLTRSELSSLDISTSFEGDINMIIAEIPEWLESWIYTVQVQWSNWQRANELYEVYINSSTTTDEFWCDQVYHHQIWFDPSQYSSRGNWITVAVIDDGVNFNHVELKHSIWINRDEIAWDWIDNDQNWYVDDINWWNFNSDSHRLDVSWTHWTAVAWIIAAKTNNWLWIAWIADSAKIMSLNVFWLDWETTRKSILDAVYYAADNGAEIINLSLWWVFTDSYTPERTKAIEYAYRKWSVIVSAAGNWDFTQMQDRNLNQYKVSPVCNDWAFNYVLWVWSVDDYSIKSDFSDYWSECVDISAPWEYILTTVHPWFAEWYNYNTVNWTSFSAPLVSWAIALLRSDKRDLKNYEIYDMIINHGTDIDSINLAYEWQIWKLLQIDTLMSTPVPAVERPSIFDTPVTPVTESSWSTWNSSNENTDSSSSETLPEMEAEEQDSSTATSSWKKELSDKELVERLHTSWLTKYDSLPEFNPDSTITREQSSKFFNAYANLIDIQNKSTHSCIFDDIVLADYSLVEHILWVCAKWMMKWSSWSFNPQWQITVAEWITVWVRSLRGLQDETMTPWYMWYYDRANELWIIDFSIQDMERPMTRIELWRVLYEAYRVSK